MAFQKGQSGNPNGRPKQTEQEREFVDLCRSHAPKAVKRLVELIDCDNVSVAAKASQIIIERAYGRPRQEIDMTTNQPSELQPPSFTITFIDPETKQITEKPLDLFGDKEREAKSVKTA